MNNEVTILLKSMTSEQLLELSARIEKQLAEVKFDELTDLRKMKPICPRCKSSQIKKVGFSKTCSKQSYQCKECGRKFFISCNSLTHATKKTLGAWMKAIESVLNHDTLDQMAIKCDIHRTTAFYWRHKILDRINDLVNKDMLSGEIYLDETLVPAAFEEPIEAKKHGMSKQKINIACAIDNHNNIRCVVSDRGRIQAASLVKIFRNHICAKSTLITDSLRSYHILVRSLNVNWKKIPSKKNEIDGYTLDRVNELHSCIKHFLYNYRGVGAKYLQNYISLFMLQWKNEYVATSDNVLLLFSQILFNSKVTRNWTYNAQNRNLLHESVTG